MKKSMNDNAREGTVCGTCRGTGQYLSQRNNHEKCPACFATGLVTWREIYREEYETGKRRPWSVVVVEATPMGHDTHYLLFRDNGFRSMELYSKLNSYVDPRNPSLAARAFWCGRRFIDRDVAIAAAKSRATDLKDNRRK